MAARTMTERVDEIEKTIHTSRGWAKGALAIVVVLGGLIIWFVQSEFIPAVHRMQETLESHKERLAKLQDAIAVLSNQQSEQTQKLIHDLLAAANKTGNSAVIAKALAISTSLTVTLRQEQRPASPEFFKTTMQNVGALRQKGQGQPELLTVLHKFKVNLAAYRSSLEPLPSEMGQFTFGSMEHALIISDSKTAIFRGGRWDFTKVTGDAIVLKGNTRNITFEDNVIKGGNQSLDGIHWKDVTFIGTHIRYKGGALNIENVHFVNCTFDAPDTARGDQLIDYAALAQNKLIIG